MDATALMTPLESGVVKLTTVRMPPNGWPAVTLLKTVIPTAATPEHMSIIPVLGMDEYITRRTQASLTGGDRYFDDDVSGRGISRDVRARHDVGLARGHRHVLVATWETAKVRGMGARSRVL